MNPRAASQSPIRRTILAIDGEKRWQRHLNKTRWSTLVSAQTEEMHAALDVNIPNYASAIVTTKEVVDSISSL